MNHIRILIVDDHPLVREGLQVCLAMDKDIQVVGEASNGREALEKSKTLKPDIVIMDLHMPEMNGLEATRLFQQQQPEVKILILTIEENQEYILAMIKAGVRGYLSKVAKMDLFLEAIHTVYEGNFHFGGNVTKVMADAITEKEKPILTKREKHMLILLAQGHTRKEMAEYLQLSLRTVERNFKKLRDKLGIYTIPELTRYAIAHEHIWKAEFHI